jgi:F-type H+/Na+-transporting ATPase subunit alpha
MAMNLEKDTVSIIVFGQDDKIKAGDKVECTKNLMSLVVSEALLGRVLNALGEPIDGKGNLNASSSLRTERKAPGILHENLSMSLYKRYQSYDSLLPMDVVNENNYW